MRHLLRVRPFILLAIIFGLLIPMTYQMIPGASEDLKAFESLRAGAGMEATAKAVDVVEDERPVSSFPEVPVIYAADYSYYGSFWNSEESHKELSQTSGNYVVWFYGSIVAFALSIAAIVWIIAIRIRQKKTTDAVAPAFGKLP